jgi:hypothetical protein
MIRALVYILVSVFVISLVRAILGVVMKGVAQLFQEEAASSTTAARPASSPSGSAASADSKAFGGELMKCPVCGTFSAPKPGLSSVREGKPIYFCSEACKTRQAA